LVAGVRLAQAVIPEAEALLLQAVALPHRLPSRLLNDLRAFVGYPSVTRYTTADMLPPAVQCPDVEAAEGDRGPWRTKDPAVVTYYTGYAYVGGLVASATPPPLRAPPKVQPGEVMWMARASAAAAPPPKKPSPAAPGGAPAVAVVLRPQRAARQVGDPAVLWADDVYFASVAEGGYWRFAHARPGAAPAKAPLTYADPAACLGQHRAYSDGKVDWMPADQLELRSAPDTARIETMTTATATSPLDAAASYKAGSEYWWF